MSATDRSMRIEELIVRGFDATELFVRHVRTCTTDKARTLLLVHGMSEHGQRYEHVAEWFADRGWNVVLPDLRGHGRSGGVRAHVGRFDEYLHDLASLSLHFELRAERTALMGHSMGALIGIRYLQTRLDQAAALVLLSPLLRVSVRIGPFTLAAGQVLSLTAPQFRFRSRVNTDHTTRNQESLALRLTDELMQRSVTARWYFAMQAARRAAWRDAAKLQVPTLVLQAGDDRIVDPAAPEVWLQRTGSSDREFRSFDGHFHELHNEPTWPQTIEIAANWLDRCIPASDSFTSRRTACGLAGREKSPIG